MQPANLVHLYKTTLAASPVLPEPFLRSVHATAVRASDTLLLVALAARTDTPADIADSLSKSDNDAVRKAAKRRVRAPGEAIVASTERKAAVLAGALSADRPNGRLFREALDAYRARPTNAIRKALLQLPAHWYEPSEAELLLATSTSTHFQVTELGPQEFIARLGSDVAAASFLRNHHCPWLVPRVAAFALSDDTAVEILARYAPDWSDSQDRNYFRRTVAALMSTRHSEERERLRQALTEAFAGDARAIDDIRHRERFVHAVAPAPWDVSAARPPVESDRIEDADASSLAALAASGDSSVLREIVKVVSARGLGSETCEVAAVALRNPALPSAERLLLLEELHEHRAANTGALMVVLNDTLNSLDVITTYPDDEQAIAAWIELAPHLVLRRHGWAPFNATGGRAQAIRKWQHTSDGNLRWRWVDALSRTRLSPADILEIEMEHLPGVTAAMEPRQANGMNADMLVKVLMNELGSDPTSWNVYTLLSSDYVGRLGDLLTACRGIRA